VINLTEPYMNRQRRILTADNFFTSINLALILFQKNINYIGTVRKNKKELPIELLANKNRPVDSSMFCFNNSLTLISYVPRKNKAVILLSTFHHEKNIDEDTKKPECILDYNQTKGGVDTVDHLIENYTCRRKSNRWTFNVFLYAVDVAAHNAYCLFKIKNSSIVANEKKPYHLLMIKLKKELMKAEKSLATNIRNSNIRKKSIRYVASSVFYTN